MVQRLYLPALLQAEGVNVRWVTDLDVARAQQVAKLFGAQTASLEEVASRAECAIVTTPPASHRAIVEACLGPVPVVLCEKPFVPTRAEATDLVDQAHASGTRLYVGHFRRLFPHVGLARDLVRMGVIGSVTGLGVSEGGKFTWDAASAYTVRERTGGVLWDTGSHTLDMALYAADLDTAPLGKVLDLDVARDVEEPSHDFYATGRFEAGSQAVALQLHLSRHEALPNIIWIYGESGSIAFAVELDTRVRLSTPKGTRVLTTSGEYLWPPQYFALQCRRILQHRDDEDFLASSFLTQIGLLEALASA